MRNNRNHFDAGQTTHRCKIYRHGGHRAGHEHQRRYADVGRAGYSRVASDCFKDFTVDSFNAKHVPAILDNVVRGMVQRTVGKIRFESADLPLTPEQLSFAGKGGCLKNGD